MAEAAINIDDDEQTEEPELKYKRIVNGMNAIIASDAVSCMSVHEKFIAVGTHWGVINILDHLGFSIENKKINIHCTTVNQISIDEHGDYMASCSDDGRVVVHGLYTTEHSQILNFDRPVKAVAIAPDYAKSRQFVTGDDRLILVSKGLITRTKTEIVHQGEGPIRTIKWRGDFIAWANDFGVKVYDIKEKKLITYVTRNKEDELLRPELYKCHIQWRDDSSFIIGWGHTVRVCEIRLRLGGNAVHEKSMPIRYVQISQYFTLSDYICGVSARDNLVLVLTYPRLEEDDIISQEQDTSSPRPQMLIAEPLVGSYKERSTDELPIRGFEKHKCDNYHLESIPGENTHFIVSPKDVVCAQEMDMDDHVEWLVNHKRFKEALETAKKNEKQLRNFTRQTVGIRYIDHLLDTKQFSEAGFHCPSVLDDKKSWEDVIYKFFQMGQLAHVAKYLPVDNPRLDTTVYEMLLNEFLQRDLPGFLKLLQIWPEDVYNCSTLIHSVLDRLDKSEIFESTGERDNLSARDRILWHSLAILYEKSMAYDKALSIYLRLKNSDVFDLIHRLKLFDAVHDKIVLLLQFDRSRAIKLLLDNMDKITVHKVVEQLNNTPELLYSYLDAVFTKDSHIGEDYHSRLVELYATYNRPKLLLFLKTTDRYNLNEALNLCQSRSFIPETVYLLGRVGKRREALRLIMDKLMDVKHAIAYCHEQADPDLWEQLILYSTDKPDFISALLENSGMDIDPRFLIKKIQPGMTIPRLRDSLVKLLHDYQVQVNLHDGCKRIIQRDIQFLLERLVRQHRTSIRIDFPHDVVCQLCGASAARELLATKTGNSHHDGFIIFFCRHVIHKGCLRIEPGTSSQIRCPVCDVDRASG